MHVVVFSCSKLTLTEQLTQRTTPPLLTHKKRCELFKWVMWFTVNMYINNKSRINRFIFKDAIFIPPCVSTQAPEHPCYRSLCMQTIIKHYEILTVTSLSQKISQFYIYCMRISFVFVLVLVLVLVLLSLTRPSNEWKQKVFFCLNKTLQEYYMLYCNMEHTYWYENWLFSLFSFRINSETGIPSDPIPFILTLCWQCSTGPYDFVRNKSIQCFFFHHSSVQ